MQRDFDLVVTILGEIRDADTAALSQRDIEVAIQAGMPDAPPTAFIAHHLDILCDAGLIAAVATDDEEQTSWRLTWKGHDALEQEDEDEEDDEDEDEDD